MEAYREGATGNNVLAKTKAIKKTAPASGGVKKMRFKAGTVALREVKKFQRSTKLLLPRASFQRVVREVAQGVDHEMRF